MQITIKHAKLLVKQAHKLAGQRKVSRFRESYIIETHPWGEPLSSPQPTVNEAWRQAGTNVFANSKVGVYS